MKTEPNLSEYCEWKKERKFIRNGEKITETSWEKRLVSGLPSGGPKKQPIPIRCAYCHGYVEVHVRQLKDKPGPPDHVEHIGIDDANHCKMGDTFTPPHQMSKNPVT